MARSTRRRATFPKGTFRSRDEALEVLQKKPLVLVKVLGAINSFKTMTQGQLAAYVGEPHLLAPAPPILRAAWSAGILDAYPLDDRTRLEPWGLNSIWRPASNPSLDGWLRRTLSVAEYVAATGGVSWEQGGRRIRHDTLAAEFGLRIAEIGTNVATVLGEPFSTAQLLLDPTRRAQEKKTQPATWPGGQRADLTVVRDDGLRIAVELVANANQAFERKAMFWAQRLAETDSGLVVVFVVAPDPYARSGSARATRSVVTKKVEQACSTYPGVSFDPTADRIGVASWVEWMPGPHEITNGLVTMTVNMPPAAKDGPWRERALLDANSVRLTLNPRVRSTARAVIANSAMLGQTVSWLRDAANAPDVVRALVRGAGVDELPMPTPVRPDKAPARNDTSGAPRKLGVGTGAAKDTMAPRRILGLVGEGRRR